MQQLINQGIQWDEMFYINFEDERLSGMMAEHLNLLWRIPGRSGTFIEKRLFDNCLPKDFFRRYCSPSCSGKYFRVTHIV